MILLNERTGERFTPCSREQWSESLDAWSADLRQLDQHPLLARLNARTRRAGWTLYRVAKRALRLRIVRPSPMPEGHCRFDTPAAYGLVVVSGQTTMEGE